MKINFNKPDESKAHTFLKLSDVIKNNSSSYIIPFERFIFNGGEQHIKIQETLYEIEDVVIECVIRTSNDVMELLMATDSLKRLGAQRISLVMPYIPYARQDRVMVDGEPLSIKVFADLINSQHYKKVFVLDPHSDVSTALINNVELMNVDEEIDEIIQSYTNKFLVAADAGCMKKIFKIAQRNSFRDKDIIHCSKIRNVSNGEILGIKVNSELDLKGSNCIIIDDIVDGGATYCGIASELKQRGAEKVILMVSHGIFSKGFRPFFADIDHIYYFSHMIPRCPEGREEHAYLMEHTTCIDLVIG